MSKAGKIVKVTIKTIMLSISLFIYAFFIFRLCTGDDPESMSKIIWNDINRAAYAAAPEEFEALEQEAEVFITDDGRFWISNIVYLPQAKQLQLTIKYNDSTLKYLKQALGDESMNLPDEPFSYSLLDDKGNRYHSYTSFADEKQNYNYRRLVFEDIDLTEVSKMYVDIYYVDSVDYSAAPYGSMMAWNALLPTEARDLSDELPDDLK